jgi:hypothetical protein
LVAKYEERSGWICGEVWDLSTSKGGTPEIVWIFTTIVDTRVEVEKYYDGLCI